MKIAEIRAKSKEELKDLVVSLKKEQFNLRMQASVGTLESQSRFKEVRRTIARVKTLLTEEPGKVVVKKEKAKKAAAPKKEAAEKPAKKTASKAKKG
jgi:large subunit ribosomal protein L29